VASCWNLEPSEFFSVKRLIKLFKKLSTVDHGKIKIEFDFSYRYVLLQLKSSKNKTIHWFVHAYKYMLIVRVIPMHIQ